MGEWVQQPPSYIPENSRGSWTIQAVGDFRSTSGNCTFAYHNSQYGEMRLIGDGKRGGEGVTLQSMRSALMPT